MIIIGISGKKRSGKDTVGEMLCQELSPLVCERIAFADEVKQTAARMIRAVDPRFLTAPVGEVLRYMEAHKDIFRPLYQWVGTEYGRTVFGEDVWIKKALQKIINMGDAVSVVIITDVRFVNEAQMVKDAGGFLLRVRRPGNESEDLHASETSLDSFDGYDYTIVNDAPLPQLRLSVQDLVTHLKHKYKIK